MRGRTGNQLFEYGFLKKIQSFSNDKSLTINFRKAYSHKYENDLIQFNISDYIDDKDGKLFKKSFSFFQKLLFFYMKVRTHLFRNTEKGKLKRYNWQCNKAPFLIKHGIVFLSIGFFNFPLDNLPLKNILVYGNFEDKRFLLDGIQDKYRIKPKEELLRSSIIKKIQSPNSVCVSIRCGDFLSKKNSAYNVCGETYFKSAFKAMEKINPSSFFIVFSDDTKLCKIHMKDWKFNIVFENDGNTIPEKLFLMSSCNNFIISNSTFSWWAQFLSLKKSKLVLSPSIWNKNFPNSPLLESDFLKIK